MVFRQGELSGFVIHLLSFCPTLKKALYTSLLQVAEVALLAQLLPPCSPTCVIRRRTELLLPDCVRFNCCSHLRPLQLLLATCVCFSCCSPLVSASAAARHLCLLQLLLPDCVRFNCSPIASASAVAPRFRPPQVQLLLWLHLQLPDCVCFDCCPPILHPSAVPN